MNFTQYLELSAVILTSLGGAGLVIGFFADRLGKVWAERMLQNERAKHSEILEKDRAMYARELERDRAAHAKEVEDFKVELELIRQKDVTRHNDKLQAYKEIIHIISEILRELEAITIGLQDTISSAALENFRLNRNKAYGYISLVSNQEVMDRYNDLIDFLIPIIYEGDKGSWEDMRNLADALLNAARRDLGIEEGNIVYQGAR